jgi:putative transposase
MRMHGWIGAVWQHNYHDHIIRNERSLERIRAYIRNNPANWHRDRNNPGRHP